MTMTAHEVGKEITLIASDVAIEFTPEQLSQQAADQATYYRGRLYYDPRDPRRAQGRYNPDGSVEYFVARKLSY